MAVRGPKTAGNGSLRAQNGQVLPVNPGLPSPKRRLHFRFAWHRIGIGQPLSSEESSPSINKVVCSPSRIFLHPFAQSTMQPALCARPRVHSSSTAQLWIDAFDALPPSEFRSFHLRRTDDGFADPT
ncbi:hypothetical protein E4U32_005742 [Claviceps aff. humidiphila group G2b]|nr:hypothetical protein E4U32_005742 [Claviceps aff. humidiphila group G2b]